VEARAPPFPLVELIQKVRTSYIRGLHPLCMGMVLIFCELFRTVWRRPHVALQKLACGIWPRLRRCLSRTRSLSYWSPADNSPAEPWATDLLSGSNKRTAHETYFFWLRVGFIRKSRCEIRGARTRCILDIRAKPKACELSRGPRMGMEPKTLGQEPLLYAQSTGEREPVDG